MWSFKVYLNDNLFSASVFPVIFVMESGDIVVRVFVAKSAAGQTVWEYKSLFLVSLIV